MDTLRFQVQIKFGVLIAGVFLTAVTAFLVYHYQPVSPAVPITLQIVGSGIALTALCYAAMTLHFNVKLNSLRILNEKKKFASDLITEWHKPDMAKLTVAASEITTKVKDLEPKQVLAYLKKDPAKQMAIATMLNYFEKMALVIHEDLADEPMLKDYFKGIVQRYYHAFIEFIRYKRKELTNEAIFERFEQLAHNWMK